MNKFLKKRPVEVAVVANDDALLALSAPPSPTTKRPSTSRWKKTKKQPEVKPQIDLTSALPSTDDFRTSLIMPSLSTRFSMLREQDDPKSLLGKASDDSVLQPRRKSRMADFGFSSNALADIAEVSSVRGSFRPPFAPNSRQPSFASADDYGSDAESTSGGIMARSRPGEGNILFGGRQKIYKIPSGGTGSARGQGKLMYEDDVGMSAFQRYRQREREFDESQFASPIDDGPGFDFGLNHEGRDSHDEGRLDSLPNDSAKDLSHSPSYFSFDKKRSTASTARSDARSSTAATSVTSQPTTSAHPSPAQAPVSNTFSPNIPPVSASPLLERANTKTRRLYEQGLDQHMQDQQTSAMSRLNSIQRQRTIGGKTPPILHSARSAGNLQERVPQQVYSSGSPPNGSPLPPLNTFDSVMRSHSGSPSPVQSGGQSPDFDENDVLSQALEPGDRGKATAMGAFNKPAQAFDEQQYLERQKVLQRSVSNAAVMNKAAARRRLDQEQQRASPDLSIRSQSSSVLVTKPESTQAHQGLENDADQYQTKPLPQPKAPLPDTHRTFFGNISASEDEDEDEDAQTHSSFNQPEYGYGNYNSKWHPTPLQSVSEHPALRSEKSKASLAEEVGEYEAKSLAHASSSRSLRYDHAYGRAGAVSPTVLESPILGQGNQPLNGLVHHLRQRSNQSSLYPADDIQAEEAVPDVPEVPSAPKQSDSYHAPRSSTDDQSIRDSTYAVSNPWDLDEQRFGGYPPVDRSPVKSLAETPSAGVSSSHQAEVSRANESDRLNSTREGSIPRENPTLSWQHELRTQHNRDASSATQQERDAFANELAARRNAIRENIKSVVERDTHSRGTSPARSVAGNIKALGMLRSKTSRESIVHVHDQPSKAMKMFSTANGSTTSLSGPHERAGYSIEMGRARNDSSARPPPPTGQHPAFRPEGSGLSQERESGERVLASSRFNAARSRSNSTATTGRSRSRTGPYRDDLEKAMAEGYGSSAAAHTPDLSPFPAASPDMGLAGDDDRVAMSNYFDQINARLANGAPSAALSSSKTSHSTRTTNLANLSQSGTSTMPAASPMIGSQTHSPMMPASRSGTLRKKTISKSDISVPTLVSSTSNVDTVDLPEGASLKNGMDEAPPIPPINPRRRTTRKIFGRERSNSKPHGDYELKATASDPALTINTSSQSDFHFPPSNAVRMPVSATSRDFDHSPAGFPYGFNPNGSPERLAAPAGPQRAVTSPLDGNMF